MTSPCSTSKVERDVPDFSRGDAGGPDGGLTYLVTEPDRKPVYTARADTDAHTAMIRGVAEYLAQLALEHLGRDVTFRRVMASWPDTEDMQAEYPMAAVYSVAIGEYDGSFTPKVTELARLDQHDDAAAGGGGTGEGTFLVQTNNLRLPITIEVWTSSKEDRVGIVHALERELCPVTWMHGFRLGLPHYHGVHIDVALISAQYIDTDDLVGSGNRVVMISVVSSIPVLYARRLPIGRVRSRGTVETAGTLTGKASVIR